MNSLNICDICTSQTVPEDKRTKIPDLNGIHNSYPRVQSGLDSAICVSIRIIEYVNLLCNHPFWVNEDRYCNGFAHTFADLYGGRKQVDMMIVNRTETRWYWFKRCGVGLWTIVWLIDGSLSLCTKRNKYAETQPQWNLSL